jgi:Na+/H+ antiporter NhaD/arsenite permease-like protein
MGMSYLYAVPFLGLLLSISLGPILLKEVWEKNYFRFSIFWSLLTLILWSGKAGWGSTAHDWAHMLFHEYLPFLLMIAALYTIAGGIHIVIKTRARARTNSLFLGIGALLASFIGTTGAAMLLIRPLITLNQHRKYKVHLVIFFIFLVANMGGILTPLGDPPLFLGYLEGVPFWWPLTNLFVPVCLLFAILIALFWLIDQYLLSKDNPQPKMREKGEQWLHISGLRNLPILLGVILGVWLLGSWKDSPPLGVFGLTWAEGARDLLLLGLAALSWKITPKTIRHYNRYSWDPLKEVAKLFIGIFTTLIPVVQMLHQGTDGPFAPLLALANPGGQPDNPLYFWMTGWLSAFLDNAPTYLLFFHMAGGNAQILSSVMPVTLRAISAGAVIMGAMTYVGNAPNFMVKSVAESHHIKMPSFFGYMLWSCIILLPVLMIFCSLFLYT